MSTCFRFEKKIIRQTRVHSKVIVEKKIQNDYEVSIICFKNHVTFFFNKDIVVFKQFIKIFKLQNSIFLFLFLGNS